MHYIAGLIELFAKYMVGRKDKWGFIVHLISGLLWSYIAIQMQLWGLLIVTVPAMGLNVWNFYKWNKK